MATWVVVRPRSLSNPEHAAMITTSAEALPTRAPGRRLTMDLTTLRACRRSQGSTAVCSSCGRRGRAAGAAVAACSAAVAACVCAAALWPSKVRAGSAAEVHHDDGRCPTASAWRRS